MRRGGGRRGLKDLIEGTGWDEEVVVVVVGLGRSGGFRGNEEMKSGHRDCLPL